MTEPLDRPLGAVIGAFADYDELVERLRRRAAEVGLSYSVIDELAGLSEGATGKYLAPLQVKHLTVVSLMKIANVLGVGGVLYVDERLLRKVKPQWIKRDAKRVHRKRQAFLGRTQMKRVLSAVACEMGRRGGLARIKNTTPEYRQAIGKAGAQARWKNRERTDA